MLLGPFDRRNKRSRCSACSTSHLKCDGHGPCSNCERRSVSCVYTYTSRTETGIRLDAAKHKTPANFSKKRGATARNLTACPQHIARPQMARTLFPSSDLTRYLYFFDVFVKRNTFATNTAEYGAEVRKLMGTEGSEFLTNAVVAVGALECNKLCASQPSNARKDESAALSSYSKSLVALRDHIARTQHPLRMHVMWTTMFLGLFELMQDETGDGWLRHMIHGTAQALQASGPSSCRDGLARSFFHQARVFEASRALLLSEPTFLSEPGWQDIVNTNPESVLNVTLNIIVHCSNLRLRAVELIHASSSDSTEDDLTEAQNIAEEGFRVSRMIDTCQDAYNEPPISSLSCSEHGRRHSSEYLLCQTFLAASSIYLSGIFDYEFVHWQSWGIPVHTIKEEDVQRHLDTILSFADMALRATSLSPLLFLFPLRIAGARSRQEWQRIAVQLLVDRIAQRFAVARIFKTELTELWQRQDLDLPRGT